uniref:Small ribosomal subunit protein uS8c n=2 Tax=Triticinae TaxID=1648030 RepID=A0A453ATX4_AEGTS
CNLDIVFFCARVKQFQHNLLLSIVRVVSTNITENIVKILLREGFIESVRKHQERNRYFLVSTLRHQKRKTRKGIYRTRTFLKRISRPGLRIYTNYQGIPKVLGGMGIAILSTSRGIMTNREARLNRIGGRSLMLYMVIAPPIVLKFYLALPIFKIKI